MGLLKPPRRASSRRWTIGREVKQKTASWTGGFDKQGKRQVDGSGDRAQRMPRTVRCLATTSGGSGGTTRRSSGAGSHDEPDPVPASGASLVEAGVVIPNQAHRKVRKDKHAVEVADIPSAIGGVRLAARREGRELPPPNGSSNQQKNDENATSDSASFSV